MRFSILTLLAAAALGHAAPNPIQPRGMSIVHPLRVLAYIPDVHPADTVSTSELSQFTFWVQYAAATYCEAEYTAEPGTKVSCSTDNCPDVEEVGATIIYSFSKYAITSTYIYLYLSISIYSKYKVYTDCQPSTTITDTAGFIATDPTHKTIVLAFRGSYSIRNWVTDAAFLFKNPDLCKGCLAEMGFWDSWANVRDDILEQLQTALAQNPGYELVVVGHSLGAAIATLAAADIRGREEEYPFPTLYAYASPRVGNRALAQYITDQGKNYRFTHADDPVPKLPLLAMGYVHVSPEYWINAPDNVTVTPGQVEVLHGEVNFDGNTGQGIPGVPDLLAFHSHRWYFELVDACKGPGLPLKRDLE